MKRSGVLQRTGTLRRFTELSKQGRRGKAREAAIRRARGTVTQRAGGVCEAGLIAPAAAGADSTVGWVCSRIPTVLHHVVPRSAGGDDTPANLVHICQPCHAYIHAHPDEAHRVGLLKTRRADSLAWRWSA